MRRLGLLACALLLIPACTRDNPAFDGCVRDDCIAAETGDGDGDGDPLPGDGDGDPLPGDGDGDPLPGDGDGDGAPGDGDGDGDGGPGDGDGDPGLPNCPDSEWVTVRLVEDTFLDGSHVQQACTIDWDFINNLAITGEGPCSGLDFGGTPSRWVCGNAGCNSTWLGRFDVEAWYGLNPEVYEAGLVFQARVAAFPGGSAQAYALPANISYGNCPTWMAGNGHGEPPGSCVTTHMHAAYPQAWPLPPEDNLGVLLGETQLSGFNLPSDTMFTIPLDPALVSDWLSDKAEHTGVLLRTGASLLQQLVLHAQNSGHDPELRVKLCVHR